MGFNYLRGELFRHSELRFSNFWVKRQTPSLMKLSVLRVTWIPVVQWLSKLCTASPKARRTSFKTSVNDSYHFHHLQNDTNIVLTRQRNDTYGCIGIPEGGPRREPTMGNWLDNLMMIWYRTRYTLVLDEWAFLNQSINKYICILRSISCGQAFMRRRDKNDNEISHTRLSSNKEANVFKLTCLKRISS